MIASELKAIDYANVAAGNIVYRPDLERKSERIVASELAELRPDCLIVRVPPSQDTLRRWHDTFGPDAVPDLILLTQEGGSVPAYAGLPRLRVSVVPEGGGELGALLCAEARATADLAGLSASPAAGFPASRGAPSVAIVGAGIVNLMTAFELLNHGFAVTVVEAGPDPRKDTASRRHGCTFGGCDARIFSFNESRHHHLRGLDVDQGTNVQFWRGISDGGWLSADPARLEPADARWIDAFARVPPWLAARYNGDIISFNVESWRSWRACLEEQPELFADVGLHDGLLRLYATAEKYARALVNERALGSVVRELDPGALGAEFPSLDEAVRGGHVAGALEVSGFSINIHKLGCRLVRIAEARGARFMYDSAVTGVVRDAGGRVAAIRCGDAELACDHYVFSSGAYSHHLLRELGSAGSVAPVIGMWLTLLDHPPYLDLPLKISRSGFASSGAAEGANVIAGTDCDGRRVIHLSSGHGYIGIHNRDPDRALLAELGKAVLETAAQYFPSKFERTRAAGGLPEDMTYCIRPWTPDGLGIFETLPAGGGGKVVVTGGHNTGGFAQSPSVARAVRLALQGESHPMHALYHPRRFANFAEVGAA
jgi:D-amino-acid dehydrogenase